MKLTVFEKKEDIIEYIPEQFKDEKKPPKFLFRSPNSSDVLRFMQGSISIDEAVFNCFLRFENKIELEDKNGKPIEYNTYSELVQNTVSVDIAIIHGNCRNLIAKKINEILAEAKKTEKKSE